jgi:hypothetical protein
MMLLLLSSALLLLSLFVFGNVLAKAQVTGFDNSRGQFPILFHALFWPVFICFTLSISWLMTVALVAVIFHCRFLASPVSHPGGPRKGAQHLNREAKWESQDWVLTNNFELLVGEKSHCHTQCELPNALLTGVSGSQSTRLHFKFECFQLYSFYFICLFIYLFILFILFFSSWQANLAGIHCFPNPDSSIQSLKKPEHQ